MNQKSLFNGKMTVASKPTKRRQPLLFDTHQLTSGTRRTYAGDFVEEVTACVTGGTRLRTSSDCDICPDMIFHKDGVDVYSEIKSVGRSDKVAIFEPRYQKDKEFVGRDGQTLVYWFWRHNFKAKEAETPTDLWRGLAEAIYSVYLVDAATVHELLLECPINEHKNAAGAGGWGSPKYKFYRNLNMSAVAPRCAYQTTTGGRLVYGQPLGDVTVYFSSLDHSEYFLPYWTGNK